MGSRDRGLGIGRRLFHSQFTIHHSLFTIVLFLLSLSLSACASTRPVLKIGLLAPFEGVYRQEGYDALVALRAALAEQNPTGLDVLPLALDTSRDVARTSQKVLTDSSVVAIIGPFWAADEAAIGGQLDQEKWFRPYAPSGNGDGAAELVATARLFAQAEGRQLVLAGLPVGWTEVKGAAVSDPDGVQVGDSILWLGDPAAGAAFAQAVWQRLPETPFGLYAAGIESFRRRVGEQMTGPLFVIGWIDDDYPVWAASHSPNTPIAYTVYRQTADVLKRMAGETVTTIWHPAIFIVRNDGTLFLSAAH